MLRATWGYRSRGHPFLRDVIIPEKKVEWMSARPGISSVLNSRNLEKFMKTRPQNANFKFAQKFFYFSNVTGKAKTFPSRKNSIVICFSKTNLKGLTFPYEYLYHYFEILKILGCK